jgi:hypothetical protein
VHAFFSLTDSVQNHENEPSPVTLSLWWTAALIVSSIFVVVGVVTIIFYPGSRSLGADVDPGINTPADLVLNSRVEPSKLKHVYLAQVGGRPRQTKLSTTDKQLVFNLLDDKVYYLFLDSKSLFLTWASAN